MWYSWQLYSYLYGCAQTVSWTCEWNICDLELMELFLHVIGIGPGWRETAEICVSNAWTQIHGVKAYIMAWTPMCPKIVILGICLIAKKLKNVIRCACNIAGFGLRSVLVFIRRHHGKHSSRSAKHTKRPAMLNSAVSTTHCNRRYYCGGLPCPGPIFAIIVANATNSAAYHVVVRDF